MYLCALKAKDSIPCKVEGGAGQHRYWSEEGNVEDNYNEHEVQAVLKSFKET